MVLQGQIERQQTGAHQYLKRCTFIVLLLLFSVVFPGCVYTVSMTHGKEFQNNEIAQLGEGEESIHIVSVDSVKINIHELRSISIRLLPGMHSITVNLGSKSFYPSGSSVATFASDFCPTLTYYFEAGHQYRIYPHLSWGSWTPYIKDEND